MRSVLVFGAVVGLLARSAGAAEPTRWLNLTVHAPSEHTEVKIHVPLALIRPVVDAIDVRSCSGGMVTLGHRHRAHRLDWNAMLGELRNTRDGETLVANQDDERVELRRSGGTVEVDVRHEGDRDDTMHVRVPALLLDSLVLDDHNRLDLKALLAQVDRLGSGELLLATSPDADVRVWVE
jgi:hypothetical protein